MPIDILVENHLNRLKLKRVRIKVDPSHLVNQGFEYAESFEGYVLEECGEALKVYIINLPPGFDPVHLVDKKHILRHNISNNNINFSNKKQKTLSSLDRLGIQKSNPAYQQIFNAKTPEFIENYLKNLNLKQEDLQSIITQLSEAVQQDTEQSDPPKLSSKATNTFGSIGSKILSYIDPEQKLSADDMWDKLKAAGARANSAFLKFSEFAKNLPGLFIGRGNVLNRLGRFMKSLDLDTLSSAAATNLKSKEYARSPKNLDKVYIQGLVEDKLNKDGFRYGLIGRIKDVVVTYSSRQYKIVDISPKDQRANIKSLLLDFSILNNKNKKGLLWVERPDGRKDCWSADISLNESAWYVVAGSQQVDTSNITSPGGEEMAMIGSIDTGLKWLLGKEALPENNEHRQRIIRAINNKPERFQQFSDLLDFIKLTKAEEISKLSDPDKIKYIFTNLVTKINK